MPRACWTAKFRLPGAKSTIEEDLGRVTSAGCESESVTGSSLAALAFRLVIVSLTQHLFRRYQDLRRKNRDPLPLTGGSMYLRVSNSRPIPNSENPTAGREAASRSGCFPSAQIEGSQYGRCQCRFCHPSTPMRTLSSASCKSLGG